SRYMMSPSTTTTTLFTANHDDILHYMMSPSTTTTTLSTGNHDDILHDDGMAKDDEGMTTTVMSV
ncbi:hypothetical protein U1Q18_016412, partial [Sarracenia purpurea var. burkii]